MDALMLALKAIGDTTDPNGEFEAILSTPDMDREGEVVMAGAFDPLPESVPVFRSHGWTRGEEPIGIATPTYAGEHLMLKGRWADTPEAQTTRKLVEGGFIKTMSAGFLTKLRDASNRKAILKAELLEGSTAPIPVNSKALILAAKSLAAIEGTAVKAGARNSASDMEHIQSAHDHMATLGAACSTTKTLSAADLKSLYGVDLAGSHEERISEVQEALTSAYGSDNAWVNVLATFDDHVVFEVNGDNADEATLSVTYDWNDGDPILGDATPVEVTATVTPVTTLSLSADAAGAAADLAAAPTADATEDVLDDLVKGIDLLVDAFAD